MNEKTKDILIRAGKTFWQAALAYLLADAAVLQEALTDWSTGKQLLFSLAVGAAAAGFSAVYNGIVRPRLGGSDALWSLTVRISPAMSLRSCRSASPAFKTTR